MADYWGDRSDDAPVVDLSPRTRRVLWREICRRYPAPDPPPWRIQVRRRLLLACAGWYAHLGMEQAYRERAGVS